MRKTRLMMGGAAFLALAVPTAWAFGVANAASTTQSTKAAMATGWFGAAPYVMPLDNNPPDLAAVMAATGQKSFELAFVLADGGCTPGWGGTAPVSADTAVGAIINTVRSAGGDVSVSFGGYGGTKLGEVCGSASATAAAYQQVITKYSVKAIDFDLEEPEYENTAAIANELGAAKILQTNNAGLYVSVTTAGTAAGTGWFGTQMLNEAKTLGFTPANYAIMPFDGGFNGAASQTAALEAFHTLLMSTFGWDSAAAYAHEGVSMMNGRSDAGEFFKQADFQTVLDYATSKGLSRYTYWAVNRDRQCPGGATDTTSGTCSSVTQTDWEFTKFTAKFGGATPPASTSPTTAAPSTAGPSTAAPSSVAPSPTASPTTGTPTTPSGSCAAAWSASTAYNGGDKVSYGGHTWSAKWWTYNEVPGGASGVWVDGGAC